MRRRRNKGYIFKEVLKALLITAAFFITLAIFDTYLAEAECRSGIVEACFEK